LRSNNPEKRGKIANSKLPYPHFVNRLAYFYPIKKAQMPGFKIKGKRFLLFLFFLLSGKIFSQNYDSLFAERERIILAGVEYRHSMIRWDLSKLMQHKLDVSYERKMNLNLSWVARLTWDYKPISGGLFPNAGIRYYYNLEERIMKRWTKRGEKTSSFSADYFQADLTAGYNWGYSDQTILEVQTYPKGIAIGPALKIGTQRNITKHLFYDFYLGGQILINYKARFVTGFSLGIVL
jgi:hypothetical protein